MTSIGDLPCRRRASAPTHSVDSNFGQAVLWSGHGTDDLSLSFGRGSRAFGGGPSRSQPAAEACGAGTDHPRLGRATGRGGDRPSRRHQPAGGVALAAALRRSRRRRAVARHDQKAGQAAHARRDRSGVVALTCGAPPGEATHWTGRTMAKAAGLSLRTVQRIWAPTSCGPIASAPSSAAVTPSSAPSSRTSSDFTWRHRGTRSCGGPDERLGVGVVLGEVAGSRLEIYQGAEHAA